MNELTRSELAGALFRNAVKQLVIPAQAGIHNTLRVCTPHSRGEHFTDPWNERWRLDLEEQVGAFDLDRIGRYSRLVVVG